MTSGILYERLTAARGIVRESVSMFADGDWPKFEATLNAKRHAHVQPLERADGGSPILTIGEGAPASVRRTELEEGCWRADYELTFVDEFRASRRAAPARRLR